METYAMLLTGYILTAVILFFLIIIDEVGEKK
jgi:hypothetical protein